MSRERTLLSIGDFIDLQYKLRQKGMSLLGGLIKASGQARTASKWNEHLASADFWILPGVRKRWNEDCTGDANLEYEHYVMQRHLANGKDLRMLSVGCGTGARERKWATYSQFALIDGIDVAGEQIARAEAEAKEAGFHHLYYYTADFRKQNFDHAPYDVILFNSSLHHFADIDGLLRHTVMPLLREDGMVMVFEYRGPNRLQWKDLQLEVANKVLLNIPEKYRVRFQGRSMKKRIYRPGIWRVQMIDPSEAIDSEDLVPALHRHFDVVEERLVRFEIAHLVLKDIAHHFIEEDPEASRWLQYVFDQEDEYCSLYNRRNMVFGIYVRKGSR